MLNVHVNKSYSQYGNKVFSNQVPLENHEVACLQDTESGDDQGSFDQELSLDQNSTETSSTTLHSCYLCEAVFNSYLDKMKHLKVIHKPAFYICELCPCKFVSCLALRNHRIAVHDDDALRKELVRFKEQTQLKKRLQSQLKGQKSVADDFDRSKQTALKQGVSNEKDELFHCIECDVLFASYNEYTEHMRHHSAMNEPVEKPQCLLCNETFHTVSELTHHLRNHDDNMIVEVGVHDGDTEDKDVTIAHVAAN